MSVDWYDAVDLMRQLLDQADSGRPDRDLVAELLPLLRAGALLEGWTDDWNEHSRNTYRELRMDALDELEGACAQNA